MRKSPPPDRVIAPADVPEEIIARVEDHAITNHQLFERAADARRARRSAAPRVVLDLLIDEELFAREARRIGLQSNPEVVEAADRARRRAAAKLLLDEIGREAQVDEATVRKMYHAMNDTAELDAIVLATEAQATAARDRLRDGADLAEEAKHSLDPEGARAGGAIGLRQRGQLEQAVAELVFSAELDTFVGPVKTELGWMVVRVRGRQVGDEETFENKRDKLRTFARQMMLGEMKRHYLEQLRAEAGIVVDEAFLEATGTSLQATEEQLAHVIATVGDETITYRDVLRETLLISRGKEGGHTSGAALKKSLARQLVDDALMEMTAIERGLGDSETAAAAAAAAEREALIVAYAEKLRADVMAVTPVQAKAYYDANPKEFERPARRTVAHIMVGSRDQAEQIRKRIAAGESFEAMAREYSLDGTSAANGGVLGDVHDGQLSAIEDAGEPAFATAIAAAKPNRVSEPIQSSSGWHLIRTTNHRPATPVPYAEVQAAIASKLHRQRVERAINSRARELRANATVEVNEAAFARAATHLEEGDIAL